MLHSLRQRRSLTRAVPMAWWAVSIALGVVLMHMVVPVRTAGAHEAMPNHHASMDTEAHAAAATHTAESGPVSEQPPCPGGHDMMHPCIGTVTSFPPMSVPAGVVECLSALDDAFDRVVTIVARAGRAPPWALSSLDDSVLLRV
ncbi:hypothetical protein HQ325_04940 [Rhodococcus sp. BP-349]|uniref:DUF6153 family protein n=1 Tax=unclassified Rhodococcus (in: high G+C Gram-positive bacteria) TaxID=192944 RepID=UPI001C9B3463|nr:MULTISPECIES: DUF6153 family protein [unclassified Rhodococcus (in: high G+C Gram-positive bacteria)]MBY6538012.1 hypothetical protein [Rhodococcus sp. BP-363]MBY6542349.1 hypothetical protein [Rhodococcus sp. BP-369]MBY6561579.1 hypothetical protein [Rhodococcus sp. BP-370]MBY6575871.1 hypothetical protein [Rhodococcus sp. BP-364]MBY6585172.1 hypothetical protein [Rhodococcus sp. BP-358]